MPRGPWGWVALTPPGCSLHALNSSASLSLAVLSALPASSFSYFPHQGRLNSRSGWGGVRGHSDPASAGSAYVRKDTQSSPSPLYDLLDFILQARRTPCAPDGVRASHSPAFSWEKWVPNPDHLPSWQTCDWHQHLLRASAASLPALGPIPAGLTLGRGPRTAKRPPLCPSPPVFSSPAFAQQLQHSKTSLTPLRFTNCLHVLIS